MRDKRSLFTIKQEEDEGTTPQIDYKEGDILFGGDNYKPTL